MLDGIVKINVPTDEININYYEDKFCPFDGELIRFCDQYSAFLEASESIKVGISSDELVNATEVIKKKYQNYSFMEIPLYNLFK